MAGSPATPYLIGQPGTAWGAAEKATWLGRQRVQRSYAQEVLTPLRAHLPAQAELFQYGLLDYTSFGFGSYPLCAVCSRRLLTDDLKSHHAFWQQQGA